MNVAARGVWRKQVVRPGVAATELAIILPLLLLLVLGCVDFGRFAYAYIAVTNAARAGAGCGSTSSASIGQWQGQVLLAAEQEMNGYQIQVSSEQVYGDYVNLWYAQVTVTYQFQTIINWEWLGISNQFPITRIVTIPYTGN